RASRARCSRPCRVTSSRSASSRSATTRGSPRRRRTARASSSTRRNPTARPTTTASSTGSSSRRPLPAPRRIRPWPREDPMKDDNLPAHDPLAEADAILSEEYYGRRARPAANDDAAAPPRKRRDTGPRPTHYKVICISMYTRDLEELDAKVAELK